LITVLGAKRKQAARADGTAPLPAPPNAAIRKQRAKGVSVRLIYRKRPVQRKVRRLAT
jgi:hypothetical protein